LELLLGAALLGGLYGSHQWLGRPEIPSYAVEIVVFCGALTWLLVFYLKRYTRTPSFATFFLATLVLKMTGSCAFILAIIILDKPSANGNAMIFVVSYLFFTALEVHFLLKSIPR